MTKNDQNRLSKKPPSPNQPCIFPFTWMGILYNMCTKDDHDQFWCGTQSNVKKDDISFLDNGVTQGWGNCIDLSVCPKEGGKKLTESIQHRGLAVKFYLCEIESCVTFLNFYCQYNARTKPFGKVFFGLTRCNLHVSYTKGPNGVRKMVKRVPVGINFGEALTDSLHMK